MKRKFKEGDSIYEVEHEVNKQLNAKTVLTPEENRYALKSAWDTICERYFIAFCDKHEFSYNYEYDIKKGYAWVGCDPGTIANVCDMFISMEDMRYDIDNDIPENYFQDWYWKNLDYHEMGLKYMNYQSYCKGAPEPYTKEQLQNIKDLQIKVNAAKENLLKTVKELGGDPDKILF